MQTTIEPAETKEGPKNLPGGHPVVHRRRGKPPTRRRKRAALPLFVMDGMLVAGGLLFAYHLRFQSGLWRSDYGFPPEKYLKALPILLTAFWGSFLLTGLYETRRVFTYPLLLANSLRGVLTAILVSMAVSFWYREYEYSRWVTVLHGVVVTLGASTIRKGYFGLLGRLRSKGGDRLRLLVVGTGPTADRLVETLEDHPNLGYEVVGYLRSNSDPPVKRRLGKPVWGTTREILPVVRDHGIQETVVALEESDRRAVSRIIHRCRAEGLGVKVVPSLTDLVIGEPGVALADDLFWVDVERTAERRFQATLKRAIDIVVSAAVLFLASPLFGLIAALVRWDSPGPAFFRQERAGENGRPFLMHKFRSMIQNAEESFEELLRRHKGDQLAFKLQDDPRVTRLGRRLRRWSLDELPQFWNVLKGEMSLVGPRPELTGIARKYDDRASERLRVRPGLTGYQQVQCRGTEDFQARLRYDLYYINNQGFFLDLAIILQTLWVVVAGKGRH